MRLTDIMSAMHLGTYAEVALVIFMLTFLAIAAHVFSRHNARAWERARHLPLDGEPETRPVAPPHAVRPDSHSRSSGN